MFYAVNYFNLPCRPGQMIGKQRMKIKGFKTREAREEWCHEYSNNCIGNPVWKPIESEVKSGTYAMVGGAWKNIKNIDPDLMAHI
jgi:hypothetical protein